MKRPPEPEHPFRGGFRVLPAIDDLPQTRVVESWGSSLGELLARSAEALSTVLGEPQALVGAPAFEEQVRAPDASTLAGALLVRLLEFVNQHGRYVTAVRASDESSDGAQAVRVRVEAGLFDPLQEPDLRLPLRLGGGSVDVWSEGVLVRARFALTWGART